MDMAKTKKSNVQECKNNVTCIMGMHRSGTSLVANILHKCGLDLGSTGQLLPPNEANPLGYFENENFTYKINDTLLSHYGGTWDNPPMLKEGWANDPSIEQIVSQAKSLIQTFSNSSKWGWKDPRASILLPFWKSLIPDLRFVICVRSPLEVAKSLARRDEMPAQKAIYLWNQYMQSAIRDTEGCSRIFVFYEDFFDDSISKTDEEIYRLTEFCGLEIPKDLSSLHDTISHELKHHKSETYELLKEDKITTECKLFYIGLRALKTDGFVRLIDDSKREDLISENISRFCKLLERFHDENEMIKLESALSEMENQITNFSIKNKLQQQSLSDKEQQISQLTEVRDQLVQEKTQLQARGEAQEQVLEEKEQILRQMQMERVILESKVSQLENDLSSMLLSRSWKLTVPLRYLYDHIQSLWSSIIYMRLRLAKKLSSPRKLAYLDVEQKPSSIPGASNPFESAKQPNNQFAVYTSSLGNYFFSEVRDLIASGLIELGFKVSLRNERGGFEEDSDWHIVIAPHEFFYLGDGKQLFQENTPKKLILVNTEQPSTQWYTLACNYFSKAHSIWETNYQSLKYIQKKGFKCDFLSLGYVPDFKLFKEVKELPEHYGTCHLIPEISKSSYLHEPLRNRPIDVLFIGSITPRREEFFAKAAPILSKYKNYLQLSDPSTPVIPGINTYMNTTTVVGLEQRSKICLNIHRGQDRYFEWHRIVMHGIWQKALVISEPCNIVPPFQPGIDFIEAQLEDIPEKIDFYLSSSVGLDKADKIATQGFKTLTQKCRLSEHLRPLVSQLDIHKSFSTTLNTVKSTNP